MGSWCSDAARSDARNLKHLSLTKHQLHLADKCLLDMHFCSFGSNPLASVVLSSIEKSFFVRKLS